MVYKSFTIHRGMAMPFNGQCIKVLTIAHMLFLNSQERNNLMNLQLVTRPFKATNALRLEVISPFKWSLARPKWSL